MDDIGPKRQEGASHHDRVDADAAHAHGVSEGRSTAPARLAHARGGLDGVALLQGLTDPQREAVTHTEGPLLVLAAAGSGKTRVITRRIAHLIAGGVPPWRILGLTFTNKAAAEMRERVRELLDPGGTGEPTRLTRGLTVSTFHAVCARLVRRYASLASEEGVPIGVDSDFTIYDMSDQASLMKRVIGELDLSTSNWPPRTLLSAISDLKNKLIEPDQAQGQAVDFYARTIAKVYASYQRGLRNANAVDFDDLLLLTAKMLRTSGAVLAECRARWTHLLIDEYQDTNHAQFLIAATLAGTERKGETLPNICVVGDPDQAIYSWRGADIRNILEFEEHYPSARVVALGQNFRSTAPILKTADTLIRHNERRKHKDLFTTREGGEPVRVVLCRDEQHEAKLVAAWFRGLADGDDGLAWRDMAVLYRTNALSRAMEDALRGAGIPYVIARGTAFFDREEIKHAIAYLRVVANPADDVSVNRIANTPTRGLGKTSLDRLTDFARREGLPLFEAMRRAGQVEGVSPRAAGAAGEVVRLVEEWTGGGTFLGQEVPETLADLTERVVRESGLESMYKALAAKTQQESDAERLDNLDELINAAAAFESEYDPASDPVAFAGEDRAEEGEIAEAPPLLALLRAYLERVSLIADADTVDPARGAVTLMTLHAAKGLEFPAAAIIGLEEGILPHSRAAESQDDLEEERRLCFVGITRAMQRLTMTTAKYRAHRGIAERTIRSRFLEELDPSALSVVDESDEDYNQWIDESHADVEDPDDRFARVKAATEARSGKLADAKRRYPIGSRVRHPQFGVGVVESLTGGESVRAKVRFYEVGTKTLILDYARLSAVR